MLPVADLAAVTDCMYKVTPVVVLGTVITCQICPVVKCCNVRLRFLYVHGADPVEVDIPPIQGMMCALCHLE